MLKKEELQNIQKYKYDELVEKIEKCLKDYEMYFARGNKYTIYLSNGERINFEFHDSNIPHLLGVNTTYLSSVLQVRGNSSYEVLKNFLNDSFSIYNKIKNSSGDFSQIFSGYIDAKLEIFNTIIYPLSPQDIYFVCKYDASKKYQSGENMSYASEYYIARKDKEENIILLGVKHDENQYYPQSSRLITSDSVTEELKILLSNQIVTFATNIKVENYQNGYNCDHKIYLDTTRTQITRLLRLCEDYGCDAATAADHLFRIKGLISKTGKVMTEMELLQELSQSLKHGRIFDLNELEEETRANLSKEVMGLINDCNNIIMGGVETDENKKLYSELQRENEELNQQFAITSEELDALRKENEMLKQQLTQTEEEKKTLIEFRDDIISAVERSKEKVNKKI